MYYVDMYMSVSIYLCIYFSGSRVKDIWVWILILSRPSYVTLGGDLAFLNLILFSFEVGTTIIFSLLWSWEVWNQKEIIAKHDSRSFGK